LAVHGAVGGPVVRVMLKGLQRRCVRVVPAL
jgi:hypothetical protein